MSIYQKISAIQKALSAVGIGKGKKNQQQGFMYRGIDDVYQAMAPLLAEHGVLILPKVVDRVETVRQTKSGGLLYSVALQVDYTFVDVESGMTHVCTTFGEGMDSADKATSKALSVSYKYLVLQAFAVPTEGASPDPDADSHEETVPYIDADKLYGQGEHAAHQSRAMLVAWWKGLTRHEQAALGDDAIQALKEIAE